MNTFVNCLSLLGSLAMFLYGMKIMSDGLEKFAGEKLRSILAAMTKNRFMGVFTGVLITALIQSSSATTVMVVSFVNAGLMTLRQSIGVIMGANIGTTVTAWIISAVGFKMDIAAFAIPLLVLGLPYLFIKQTRFASFGEFIFGFSFLFMGLTFLQTAATDLNIGALVAEMLSHISNDSFGTILIFVLVGALVTMLVQASAATMAITLMLFDMKIPGFGFEQAAALAMGQNIGTTVTAFLASLTTNTQARRAALAHMFFNVFGVIVILTFFYKFCDAISWFVTDLMNIESNELFKLSAFHSAFNIINTLLLIGFVPQIERFVCKMLPQKEEEEEYRLKYISSGIISASELSLVEAQKEIITFAERCIKMFSIVKNMLTIEKDAVFAKEFERITKYEKITDNMEMEIAKYLGKVSEGHLSIESKKQISKMLKVISELESVGDACYNLGRTLNHKREVGDEYTTEQMERINTMIQKVDVALSNMNDEVRRSEGSIPNMEKTMSIERDINKYRNSLKELNLSDISNNKYNYRLGVHYMDFINECEHLGDYIVNVVQSSN